MVRRDCKKVELFNYVYEMKVSNLSMSRTSSSVPHILIFNQQSQRDGDVLLKSLFHALRDDISIQHAIFCTNRLNLGFLGVENAMWAGHMAKLTNS